MQKVIILSKRLLPVSSEVIFYVLNEFNCLVWRLLDNNILTFSVIVTTEKWCVLHALVIMCDFMI